MPSLAFAAVTHTFPTVGAGANQFSVDEKGTVTGAAKDYVTVIKAPTHAEKGLVEVKCLQKFCDEVDQVEVPEIKHTYTVVEMTPAEYAAAKVAQGEKSPSFEKTFTGDNKCLIKVNKCSCGYLKDYVTVGAPDHTAPSTKLPCDESYVCTTCLQTVKVANPTHQPITGDAGKVVKNAAYCGNGKQTEYTCKWCNEKYVDTEVTADRSKCEPKKEVTPAIKSNGDCILDGVCIVTLTKDAKGNWNGIANTTGGESTLLPGYKVSFDYTTPKFYVWDTVVTPATTCGGNDTVDFTCKYCGQLMGQTASVATTGHDWEIKEIAATCTQPVKEYKVCKTCGKYATTDGATEDYETATKTDKKDSVKLGHSYVVKKVDATCADAAYYVAKCSACGDKKVVEPGVADAFADKDVSMWLNPMTGLASYEKKAGCIELPYVSAKKATDAHKYTKKVVLSEATCTDEEYVGYKCDTCGKICVHGAAAYMPKPGKGALDHDWKKVEIPATCGDYGKTLEQCSRCSLYKKGAGTTDDITEADSPNNLDAKPLVAPGAQHSFDKWVVTKASTVFEEGVKTLTCSVCGAHDATKTVIAKKTVAKASNTVKAGKKSFNVKSSAANATGYRVYYKKAGAKSWKSYTKKTASLSKTFSGLSKGKYYVKVKAYAKNYAGDGQVVWGATSSTKSVKVK